MKPHTQRRDDSRTVGDARAAVQSQKAVTAYLKSEQLLPFGFLKACWWHWIGEGAKSAVYNAIHQPAKWGREFKQNSREWIIIQLSGPIVVTAIHTHVTLSD